MGIFFRRSFEISREDRWSEMAVVAGSAAGLLDGDGYLIPLTI
jgi:hypothetical protein